MKSDRDLGPLGESTLEVWAAQAGIIANRSVRDEGGWDHHIQIRQACEDIDPAKTLDLRPAEFSSLVQVKATAKPSTKRVGVKLVNWLRFIDYPLPCFFLILDFGVDDAVRRAFLVHVNRYWIEKGQKRLRELSSTKDLTRVMYLTWSDDELLESFDGRGFRAGMEAVTGGDLDSYVSKKQEWKATAGYEPMPIKGVITFPEMSEDEHWAMVVDFALGLRQDMPISKFAADKMRFGIPEQVVNMEERGLLSFGTQRLGPTGRASIVFRRANASKTIRLDFDAYVSQLVFPFIPEKYRRIRLVASCLQLMIWPDMRMEAQILLPDQDLPTALTDLSAALDLLRFLLSRNGGISADISVNGILQNCELKLADAPTIEPNFNVMAGCVEMAVRFAKHAEVDLSTRPTIRELLEQVDSLKLVHACLEPTIDGFHVEFELDGDGPAAGEQVAVPMLAKVKLGDDVVFLGAAAFGVVRITTPEGGGRRFRVDVAEKELFGTTTVPSHSLETFTEHDKFEEIVGMLEKRGCTVIRCLGV